MPAPSSIAIEDFDYCLPEENIAKFSLADRDKAKLLCLSESGEITDRVFSELPNLLNQNTLLILNNTKVVYARLFFQKESGSTIEIFCLEPIEPCDMQLAFSATECCKWKCLIGNNRKWKEEYISRTSTIGNNSITLTARRIKPESNAWIVEFRWDKGRSFAEVLQNMGVVPLPPYLKRKAKEQDKTDYQTIYANPEGSVAAPTAGLHFSDKTFEDLKSKGIKHDFVTLHVGAGTFKPVTTKTIGEHIMHTEKVCINKKVIEDLLSDCKRQTICVGTTSVRTMESLYWHGVKLISEGGRYQDMDIKQWEPYEQPTDIPAKEALQAVLHSMEEENLDTLYGQTQIIIAPTYEYRLTDGMITNFHQPKSTLLLLVSAMIGDEWKKVYKFALTHNYRFLSFGDACLFLRPSKTK